MSECCPLLLRRWAGLCSTGRTVRVSRVALQNVRDGGVSLPLRGYASLCCTGAVQRSCTCAPRNIGLFSTTRVSSKSCRLFSSACGGSGLFRSARRTLICNAQSPTLVRMPNTLHCARFGIFYSKRQCCRDGTNKEKIAVYEPVAFPSCNSCIRS